MKPHRTADRPPTAADARLRPMNQQPPHTPYERMRRAVMAWDATSRGWYQIDYDVVAEGSHIFTHWFDPNEGPEGA